MTTQRRSLRTTAEEAQARGEETDHTRSETVRKMRHGTSALRWPKLPLPETEAIEEETDHSRSKLRDR